MKKFLIISLALLIGSVAASAQSGFGIKAGLDFNSMKDIEIKSVSTSINNKTGFHAGILYKINLPLGLAIQPELLYSQRHGAFRAVNMYSSSTNNVVEYDLKSHYMQLPVNVQWGLDLMLLRPFIMVSPYLSYNISNDISSKSALPEWDKEKLGYGIGLGAGLDIWRLQVTGKYNWDLGKVSEFKWQGTDTFKGGQNRGFELSLAFIF